MVAQPGLASLLQNATPDRLVDLVERHLDAAARWDLICLGTGVLTFTVYITPLSGVVQGVWRSVVGVKPVVEKALDKADTAIKYWSPALQSTPKQGDRIDGYTVTSPWGPRSAPTEGASTFHQGVDLNTPMGTPLYAIGRPGDTVSVRCWQDSGGGGTVASYRLSDGTGFDYLHLSHCANGKQPAGSIVARTGSSGHSTGPHIHITQRDAAGKKIPPQTGYVWAALKGSEPQPFIARGV